MLTLYLQALDAGVGQIVRSLKRSGLWDNSVVLFSTDNGGSVPSTSNLPLKGSKESVYEGGVRGVAVLSGGILSTVSHHQSDQSVSKPMISSSCEASSQAQFKS